MENNLHPTGEQDKKPSSPQPLSGLPGEGHKSDDKPDNNKGPEIIHIGSAGAFSESEGEITDEREGMDKDRETPY